jgi:major type 1 subunit fimbrin (pilin)
MNCKGWLSKSINRTVRAALACLAMCLLGVPLFASAQSKCTASPSVAAALPATIYVNPNLGTGGGLTSWLSLSIGAPVMYSCTGNASLGAAIRVVGLPKSGIQVPYGGGTPISVFDTNVPGVGVAFAASFGVGNCTTSPLDLGGLPPTTPASGTATVQFTPSSGVWLQCADAARNLRVNSIWMQFVKTGPISGGTVTPSVPMLESSYSLNGVLTKSTWSVTAGPTVVQGLPTCTVKDVTVAMGSYKSSAFGGIGTTTPAKDFEVSVTCPPGMMLFTAGLTPRPMAIGYRIYSGGTEKPSTNVFALSSGSTAQGIALRISNAASAPFGSDNVHILGYNATYGASQSVKFQAAYQQIDATVTPGTANAVLIFAMNYQ